MVLRPVRHEGVGFVTDLRTIERTSIRDFVQSVADAGYLSGRVLDYGAGRMPYAEIVRSGGGEYHAFDRTNFPASVATANLNPRARMANGQWDAILVNQVLQYVPDQRALVALWFRLLRHGGHLVITGKTSWPEVEVEDLGGLTVHGARALLRAEGFAVMQLESRAEIPLGSEKFSLGFGAVARRPAVLIYVLRDPCSGEPRYVGQTTTPPRKRLRGHVNEALREKSRPVSAWIRSLAGSIPVIEILETDPENANAAERHWFMEFVREGHELLNVSVGARGEQPSQRRKRGPMSAEQRGRVSEFFKGRPKSPESNILRSVSASQRGQE